MAGRRVDRLNEQFKRELMHLVQRELRDPRVAAVTITEVRVAPDLSYARVFLTALAADTDRPTVLEGMRAAAPFLRGELGRRMRIRRAPELAFQWDEALDHAQRIERLLSEVLPRDPPEMTSDDEN
ncbi:MAG: 30S ribosome-binding factor RbfA [Longimicrobiales bacterium]